MKGVRSVAVLGCGFMGSGIAEACARAGLPTIAIKLTSGDVGVVRDRILEGLDRAVQKGKLEEAARDDAVRALRFSRDLGEVAQADLVIESAVEDVGAKQDLLGSVERHVAPGAILASNTSSLPLAEIALRLEKPERFVGLHFFAPPVVMKLVEVAGSERTRPEVVALAQAFVERIGKTPVVVRDHAGYVVNRLLVPLLLQAMETLEQRVAGIVSIDTAMRLGCAHPQGPLALADFIGLDVVLAMAKSLAEELNDERYRIPPVLRRLVASGQLGRKTGAGFYLYRRDTAPAPNPAAEGGIPL